MLSSTIHKHTLKKSTNNNNKKSIHDAEPPITKDLVLSQLEEMGYPRDLLPKDVLDNFVQELKMEMEQSIFYL